MNKNKSRRQRVRSMIESCEARRLFVGFTIEGTSAADTISIGINGNDILYVVNGVSDSRSDILFNEVTIAGNGGSDQITIVETGNNAIVVNGGNGDDTIRLGDTTLTAIDDNVTVNGDAGNDTTLLMSTGNAGDYTFSYSFGNTISGGGMAAPVLANTENVELRTGAGANDLFINDTPSSNVLFNGGGGFDAVVANGAAGESVTYQTGGQSGGSGSLHYPNSEVEFFSTQRLSLNHFDAVTFDTSFLNDDFTIDNLGSERIFIQGISGTAAAPTPVEVFNVDQVTMDLSSNNASDVDELNFIGTSTINTLFRVDMGGGTNTVRVDHDFNIDTRIGFAGGQFNDIVIDSANARFQGLQTPKSLTVRDGGTASFNGTGQLLATPTLFLPSGVGNLNLPSGTTGTLATALSIASTAQLNKLGGGTFTVPGTVAHTHGVGATLRVAGGIFNLNGDAGSPSARRLHAMSAGGTLVLGSSQHLKSVLADGGTVRLGNSAQGDRVIVTEAIGVNSDIGGRIDLTNNNLILDYAGASQETAVRDLLTQGYAGGAWNGVGLQNSIAQTISTVGLGYAHAPDLFSSFPATFAGETIDSTSVVVRHTLNGDTNLDRVVNFDDLLTLSQNYGPSVGGKSWRTGNFNYNTADNVAFAVGFNDLLALAQNYTSSSLSFEPARVEKRSRRVAMDELA